MAINTNGLPLVTGNRTLTSGVAPIALGNEVRGGIHRISGGTGDTLGDIPGTHLQAGLLVYNEDPAGDGSQPAAYFMYRNVGTADPANPDSNDPFRNAEGAVPNVVDTPGSDMSNWIEFNLNPEMLQNVGNVFITSPVNGQVLEYSTDVRGDGSDIAGWVNSVDNVINSLQGLDDVTYGTGENAPAVGQVLEINAVDAEGNVTWTNAVDNPLNNRLENLADVYIQGTPTQGMVLEYRNDIPNPTPGDPDISGWTNATDSLGDMITLSEITNVTQTNDIEAGRYLRVTSVAQQPDGSMLAQWEDAAIALNEISEVDVTNPEVGQFMSYQEVSGVNRWTNFTAAIGALSDVADDVSTLDPNDPDDTNGSLVFDGTSWMRRPRAVPSTPADQLRIFSPGSTTLFEPAHFLYELRVDIDRAGNRTVSWMETPGQVGFTIQDRPDIDEGETAFRTGDGIYHAIGFTGSESQTVTEEGHTGFFSDLGPLVWGVIQDTDSGRSIFGAQPSLWFIGDRPSDTSSQFAQSNFDGTTFYVNLDYNGSLSDEGATPNLSPTPTNQRADGAEVLRALREAIPAGEYTFEADRGRSFTAFGGVWFASATILRNQAGVEFRVPQPPRGRVSFGAVSPDGTITANTSMLQTTELAGTTPSDPLFVFEHGGIVQEASIAGSDFINVTRRDATADIPYPRVQVEQRGTLGITAQDSAGTPITNPNTSGGRGTGELGENHFPTLRAGTGIELRGTSDQLEVVNTFMEQDADTVQVTVDDSVPRGTNGEFIQVFVRGASDRANQYYTERSGVVQYNFRAGDQVVFGATGLRFDVETLAGGTNPFARDDIVAFSIVNALPDIPSLPVGDYSARVIAAASQSTAAGAGTVSWTNTLFDIKTEAGFDIVPPSTTETQAADSFNNGDAFVYGIAVNTTADTNDPFISLVHSQFDQNSAIRLRSTDQVITERTGLGEISIRGNLADSIGAENQDNRLISSGQTSQALNHLHDTVQQEVRDQRLEDHRGVQPVRSSGTQTQITENQRNLARNPYFHYRTDARTGLDRATATSFEFRVVGGTPAAPTQGVILLYLESPDGNAFDNNAARLVAFSDWVANSNVEYVNEHGAVIWKATTSYIGDGGTINVSGTDVAVPQVGSPEEAVIVLNVDARDLDVFTQDRGTWVQSGEADLDGANHLNRFFFTGVPSAFGAAATYLAGFRTVTAELDLSNVVYVKTDDSTSPDYEWEARPISSTTTGNANDLLDRTGVLAEIDAFPDELSTDDRRKLDALGVDTGTDNELETITMDNGFIIGNADAQPSRTEANVGIEYTSAPDDRVEHETLGTIRFEIDTPVQTPGITRGNRLILRVGRTPDAPHDTTLPMGDYAVLAATDVAAGDTTIDIQDSFSRIDPDTRTHPETTFQIADADIVNGSIRLFAYQEDTIPAMPSALTLRPTAGATSGLYRFSADGITIDGNPIAGGPFTDFTLAGTPSTTNSVPKWTDATTLTWSPDADNTENDFVPIYFQLSTSGQAMNLTLNPVTTATHYALVRLGGYDVGINLFNSDGTLASGAASSLNTLENNDPPLVVFLPLSSTADFNELRQEISEEHNTNVAQNTTLARQQSAIDINSHRIDALEGGGGSRYHTHQFFTVNAPQRTGTELLDYRSRATGTTNRQWAAELHTGSTINAAFTADSTALPSNIGTVLDNYIRGVYHNNSGIDSYSLANDATNFLPHSGVFLSPFAILTINSTIHLPLQVVNNFRTETFSHVLQYPFPVDSTIDVTNFGVRYFTAITDWTYQTGGTVPLADNRLTLPFTPTQVTEIREQARDNTLVVHWQPAGGTAIITSAVDSIDLTNGTGTSGVTTDYMYLDFGLLNADGTPRNPEPPAPLLSVIGSEISIANQSRGDHTDNPSFNTIQIGDDTTPNWILEEDASGNLRGIRGANAGIILTATGDNPGSGGALTNIRADSGTETNGEGFTQLSFNYGTSSNSAYNTEVSATDRTASITHNVPGRIYTNKTDLFLGTVGANGTLTNPLITFTWTQYTTAGTNYYFLDGINRVVAGDGSVSVTPNGDGVWTTSSPVGAADVATYIGTLTEGNSANLIG